MQCRNGKIEAKRETKAGSNTPPGWASWIAALGLALLVAFQMLSRRAFSRGLSVRSSFVRDPPLLSLRKENVRDPCDWWLRTPGRSAFGVIGGWDICDICAGRAVLRGAGKWISGGYRIQDLVWRAGALCATNVRWRSRMGPASCNERAVQCYGWTRLGRCCGEDAVSLMKFEKCGWRC